jgi:hypothetical protein
MGSDGSYLSLAPWLTGRFHLRFDPVEFDAANMARLAKAAGFNSRGRYCH